ncbi:MAG: histidinol-phosphate transaminase [Candidatus Aminicenantes bacterium]|nr:histidinol-phosphate transaminase [Candidatus Aminicenantes bacterium]
MIRPNKAVLKLKKYVPALQDFAFFPNNGDYLKLDSNEATIKPSPLVFQRIQEFLASGHLNWYPDIKAKELRHKLTDYTGRNFDEIQVFNGSDSALDYICRTFLEKDDRVLVASPTYDKFRIFVESTGSNIEFVYSGNPFVHSIQNLIERITNKTKLVYICNPNNPTGMEYSENDVRRLLEKCKHGILVVDEAYYEFSKITMSGLIDEFSNIIVTRSFSKAFGLAALRCGYILSDAQIVNLINKIRDEKNVNAVAQIAAVASLDDLIYTENYVKEVNLAKKWLFRELNVLGYKVIITSANYILVKVEDPDIFINELRKDKILVRDRSYFSQLENYVRITVGSRIQCEKLIKSIKNNGRISRNAIQS